MGVERFRKSIILALTLLFISSMLQCTSRSQIVKEDDETILRKRVQEFWSYKIKGEWDKSYPYESPEYREKTKLEIYIVQNQRSVMRWEEFEILELWASGEEGFVKLKAKFRYLISRFKKAPFERVVEEQWLKKEGQWYHFSPPA